MTDIRISPTRLSIYRLLVDGKEPGKPLIAARVAEELRIKKPTVHEHIEALKLEGYIEPIKGMRNPVLFTRGPRALLLDERVRSGVSPNLDGGPNAQYCGKGNNNTSIHVPTGETHVNGRYIFPVVREGDKVALVKDDHGQRRVEIFEKEPVDLQNVRYWKGKVQLEDGTILKVHFYESAEPALHVWPDPVTNTASTIRTSRDRLEERATEVVSFLGKYAGWRVGDPRFVPNEKDGDGFHYATNDPAIMGNFPLGYQPPKESGFWGDGTPPPRSIETDDEEKAQAVLDYYGVKKGQELLGRRVGEIGKDLGEFEVSTQKEIDQLEKEAILLKLKISRKQLDVYSMLDTTTDAQEKMMSALNLEVQRSLISSMPQGTSEAKGGDDKGRFEVMYS